MSKEIKDKYPDVPRVEVIFDGLDNPPIKGDSNRVVQLGLNKNKPGNDEYPDYIQVVRYVWEKHENGEWNVEMLVKKYIHVGEEE